MGFWRLFAGCFSPDLKKGLLDSESSLENVALYTPSKDTVSIDCPSDRSSSEQPPAYTPFEDEVPMKKILTAEEQEFHEALKRAVLEGLRVRRTFTPIVTHPGSAGGEQRAVPWWRDNQEQKMAFKATDKEEGKQSDDARPVPETMPVEVLTSYSSVDNNALVPAANEQFCREESIVDSSADLPSVPVSSHVFEELTPSSNPLDSHIDIMQSKAAMMAEALYTNWLQLAMRRVNCGIMVCHLIDYFEDAISQQFIQARAI